MVDSVADVSASVAAVVVASPVVVVSGSVPVVVGVASVPVKLSPNEVDGFAAVIASLSVSPPSSG
ncbi:hypothetical protein OV203_44945 [Nannocystis sp. ILAH1]|uniref:hypothetical protein n=1 Tax=Nannocystis sp. ILAH1 TaxID=2996789 RepID=UPI00226F9237|nr:hypothetical protein [Nannocystis sp. ILAH1]MCY0994357.1 hypothetical protein [Nannocystis sp. ILAH1]